MAFKNSFDGDIFIGVNSDGLVSGINLLESELVKWREKMGEMIGAIVPGTDELVYFCENCKEAILNVGKECFISIVKLGNDDLDDACVIWIHVPKGREKLYFSTEKDVTAFVRVAAQTKRMANCDTLFTLLASLRYRKIGPTPNFDEVFNNAVLKMDGERTYEFFREMESYESHEKEFKVVFNDDPVKKIVEKYVAEYCCALLNSGSDGTIYFGIQEEIDTKQGVVVGVVLSIEQRLELLEKSIKVLQRVYPPVDFNQISITFNKVTVPSNCVLTSNDDCNGRKIAILEGPPNTIRNIWPKFVKDKYPNVHSRVVRIHLNQFCVIVEHLPTLGDNFLDIVQDFTKKVKTCSSAKSLDKHKVNAVLDNLCVVEISVQASLYPVHLTKPLDTHVFNSCGELRSLAPEELLYRFGMKQEFDITKFLTDVNHFDPAGNSYIMIASPFKLPTKEQDIYGLVIPKWTLAIDFDEETKEEGHFFNLFKKLHDRYHEEPNVCLVTPQSDSLDLNANNGIRWFPACGNTGIAESSSEKSELKSMTHQKINKLLKLVCSVPLNKVHVVVFWDKGWKKLSHLLRLLLDDILSICNNTPVTFVCSTSEAYLDIEKDVKRLKENCAISTYITPLHVLAKFLALSLPETIRTEDLYQVPKKEYSENASLVTVPTELPPQLRQDINGRLKMMYINKSRTVNEKSLREEQKKFYSGSQITMLGLRGHIGIRREKLQELEQVFNDLLNDKKSRVSLIKVKAHGGAGTTTMCLQFLYDHHEKIPCAQLIEIHRDLLCFIEKINHFAKLPLLLLVDEEVGNLQEFLDFKKEAENRRTVNIIFLVVEPVQPSVHEPVSVGKADKPKKLRDFCDTSFLGTSNYREISLVEELEKNECEKLADELVKICPDQQNDKVIDLKYSNDRTVRNFAYFTSTAFGK